MTKTEQPTQEQWEEVLKWCGFRYEYHDPPRGGWYLDGKFQSSSSSSLTLDNLFKWVVPKVLEKIGKEKLVVLVNNAVCDAVDAKVEVATALFWAVWEVIHAK